MILIMDVGLSMIAIIGKRWRNSVRCSRVEKGEISLVIFESFPCVSINIDIE